MKTGIRKFLSVGFCALLFSGGALAVAEPQWLNVDTNKDGRPEIVASTNLADIAFNSCGEIVGWYFKTVKGSDFNAQPNGFQKIVGLFLPFLLPHPGYPEVQNLLTSPAAVVVAPGLSAAKCNAQQPSTSKTAAGQLQASFTYTNGAANVQKKFLIEPRRLTLSLDVNVTGIPQYDLEFVGLRSGPTTTKVLDKTATEPLALGEAKNVVYASLQALQGIGYALVVQPAGNVGATVGKRLQTIQTAAKTDTTPEKTEQQERGFIAMHLSGAQSLRVYGGANELIRLSQEGFAKNLGLFKPNVFGEISLAMVSVLEWLRKIIGSWGLAIIVFSVLIRLVQWPLMQSSAKSMTATQTIQPLVNKLKEQYKDNPQKLNEETMKLYQEKGVNPLGGCLPMLIPMPVLIVMWRVFSNYEFDQGFLWLRDLSLPDALKILGVLYILVNLATLYVNTRANPDMFRQQLPIYAMYIFWAFQFPAGVTLYWIITMIIGVVQQDLINRRYQIGNYAPADVKAAQAASWKSLMNRASGKPDVANNQASNQAAQNKTIDANKKPDKKTDQKPNKKKS